MKIKTVTIEGVVYAVLDAKGLPVYIHDNNEEHGFDAAAAAKKIGELNGEAQGHRQAKEAAETALKPFEGIDPVKAKKAIETVDGLDAGQLIQAGKVEEVKAAAIKAVEEKFQAQVTALETQNATTAAERDKIKADLDREVIGGNFARSEYIKEKCAIPPDFMQSRFGENFKWEDGRLVGYDADGKKIYSPARPGELANFDEAMNHLVTNSPSREHILKGGVGGGGGAQNPGGPSDDTPNPWKDGDTFNLTKQGQIARDNPELAKRLAAAAGKPAPVFD